ncbi:MAG: F0F1 ATP synthase subunit B [uncultured bacterium]|nr:MAG: F0F1 ATP synthase subunit B [uncultured bacterium]OGT25553.1 MAG: F0F1 ATP synthase subunit B [Gammaproteobacteria bacterium RIFCSPHIGHO2_02_FULL_42_43]OGT28837.1 MAG: F0F1 ATP synthase subunit B [Gammaproteobacteria bacterium RIFCSPHIGHO2_01_FULL_42_8]OGT51507.1 MAG: F0F1 ATP synthase subunit B [Gammaproteobacteria bacterium RIFCSPHIGHO2_12_FULL_41_25]OGT62208.1 MAG: F0F1 ATP synthase subunit B [Gammaproteobacteria bacterium RIFCSPLOWO2_02_FULL_42_14]OGT85881.1 MAG: F0F1 ATP synthase 
MNLNLTLLGEMITFVIFVWFTMRFVWPPLMKAMDERREKIANGLASAEKAARDLELAHHKATEILTEAKTQAAHIIEQANQRANHIVEEGKVRAHEEGNRLLAIAKSDIEREHHGARETLIKEVSTFAIMGAEKILQHEVDKGVSDQLVSKYLKSEARA